MAKKKKKRQQGQIFLTPLQYIKQKVRTLEKGSCYMTDDLKEVGEGHVIVTRLHKNGKICMGIYLIDIFCLGVKDSFYRLRMETAEFEGLLYGIPKVRECSYEEAHNWVYGSIAFAEEAGIEPDDSFRLSQYFLEEDTDDIPLIEYEFGKDGKHHLFCQNNLEASKYMPLLKKNLGDNFKFTIAVDKEFDLEAFNPENLNEEDIENNPNFKIYGPSTEYAYQHPEYPKDLNEEDRILEKMFSNPKEGHFISNKTIEDILSRPHDTISAQLERIILYNIGQTYDGISKEYDEDGFSAIIPLCVALLGEVGNEESSLDVLLEILRQTEDFYDYHFSDWAEFILVPALYKLGNNRLDRLMEFIHEPGLYFLFKYIVFHTITQIGIQQPNRRKDVISWYREVVIFATEVLPKTQYIDSTLSGLIVSDLVDLQAKELLPEIHEMYKTQLVDLSCCGDYLAVCRIIGNPHHAGHSEADQFDIYKQIKEIKQMMDWI